MRFFGKKKPWDYSDSVQRLDSIKDDYPNDEDVLKKVVKEDSNINVRAFALLHLMRCSSKISDVESLVKYMVVDLGLPEKDIVDLMEKLNQMLEQ